MKEIIRKNFETLEWFIKQWYFQSLSHSISYKDSLCYSDSFRDGYGIRNSGYESILVDCLISTLREINDKQIGSETPTRNFLSNHKKSNDNFSYFYSFEFDDDEDDSSLALQSIKPIIFSMFGKDVVFATKPLERGLFEETPFFLESEEEQLDKYSFLKHFNNNNINKNMMVVLMKRKPNIMSGRVDNLIERVERHEIRERLKKDNIEYLYFEDFITRVLPNTISEFLKKKLEQFINWVKHIETDAGYFDMVKSEWESIIHELTMSACFFVQDANDEIFESKSIPPLLFSTGGFDLYLENIKPENHFDVEWLASFSSSEQLFTDVGYINGADNTSIVAGYLKSVEQLLTNLIIRHANSHHYEPKVEYYENGKHHTLTIDESYRNKATLGKLDRYIENSDYFINDLSLRKLFISVLKPWVKDIRNGHFHKDVIHSYRDICLIRDNSYLITLLILNIYYYDELFKSKNLNVWKKWTKTFELNFVCLRENIESFVENIKSKKITFERTNNSIVFCLKMPPNYLYHCQVWLDEENVEGDDYISTLEDILLLLPVNK